MQRQSKLCVTCEKYRFIVTFAFVVFSVYYLQINLVTVLPLHLFLYFMNRNPMRIVSQIIGFRHEYIPVEHAH